MPTKTICKCCKQSYENHLMIACSVCKEKFKNTCVDITANEVRTLNSNKGYDWTCINCREIGKDLKDLKALIITLQNDIKELKTNQNHSEGKPESFFEEIVQEITERERRKNNIILFNVTEQVQNLPKNELIESEKKVVIDIVKYVDPDFPVAHIKPFRLGVYSPSKNRPIKLVLENENAVRKILKNANKIRSSNAYKKVNFSTDKTKRQIDHYKVVKQELTNRLSAGETNCRIKYINNIPRVVSEN